MKISKKVREEAALICAIAASTPSYANYYGGVVRDLGLGRRPSFDVALSAWMHVHRINQDHTDAEAESLLRTGWCPGDEL